MGLRVLAAVVADVADEQVPIIIDGDVFPVAVGHIELIFGQEFALAGNGIDGGIVARVAVSPIDAGMFSRGDDAGGFGAGFVVDVAELGDAGFGRVGLGSIGGEGERGD